MIPRRIVVLALLLASLPLPMLAQSGRGGEQRGRSGPGTGNPNEYLVPWLFLEKGAPMVKGPVVLYWLPASREEVERSPLLTSRALLDASVRCLGLEIVLPDDAAIIEKLGATGRLPAARVVDSEGKVTRGADNVRGVLRPAAVEQLARDELSARDDMVYDDVTEARKKAAAGDKDGAIALYRKIWDERCLFPLIGREAQRALAALGVTVVEPPPSTVIDPNLPPAPKTTTQAGH